ncbi:hypothetical protein QOT17_007229 [Balamuthia mandrillaris]
MLQTAEEAKAVGIANVEQLYLQGEQLERARKGVEHANQQLDTATWLLRGMHSYTGALLNYFSAPPLPSSSSASRTLQKKSAEERQNNNDDDEEDNWVIVGSSSCTSSSSSSSSSASSSSSLQPRKQQQLERTNEVEEQRGTRKKEAWENQLEREDDLSELHKAVSSLKELSLEAGNEVVRVLSLSLSLSLSPHDSFVTMMKQRRQNQQLDEYKDSLQGTRDKMKKNQKLLKERKRGGYLW